MTKIKKCDCLDHEVRYAGVKAGICQRCKGHTEMPDRKSAAEMEVIYKRVLAEDAAEVRSWPEWRRHPTFVPRAVRKEPPEK